MTSVNIDSAIADWIKRFNETVLDFIVTKMT